MNRTEKAELIETLQSAFNESSTIVVAHQVGMTVAESGDLRKKMRDAEAGFKVTKNRIAKLALKGTRFEDLDSLFTGPTAVGMSQDPVSAAKILVDYAKGNKKLTIVGGSMDGKTLDKAGVKHWPQCLLLTNCVASLSGLSKLRQPKLPGLRRLRPAKLPV